MFPNAHEAKKPRARRAFYTHISGVVGERGMVRVPHARCLSMASTEALHGLREMSPAARSRKRCDFGGLSASIERQGPELEPLLHLDGHHERQRARLSGPNGSWRLQLDCHGPSQTADSGPPSTEHGACGEDSGLGCMPRASDGVEHTLHDTYRGNQTLCLLTSKPEKTGREI